MSKARVTFPSAPDTSAINIEDEGILIISNPDTMNFTGAGVTVTESPAGTALVDIPDASVKFWTESESATTQQNTRWIPNNAAADVAAVVQPKGTGANLAQRPDGTTVGGVARGQYATDWQKNRSGASQVASGNNSIIAGGRNNTASGADSTVIGGSSCSATGGNSIAGGDQVGATGLSDICIGSESLASGGRSTAIGRSARATAQFAKAETGGNQSEAPYANSSGGGAKNRNAYSNVFSGSFGASGSGSVNNYSGRTQEGVAVLGYNSRLTGSGVPPQLINSAALFYLNPGSGINVGPTSAWLPAKDNQFFTWQIKLLATVTAITGTATGVNVGDVKQWNFEGSGKIVAGTRTVLNAATTPVVVYEDLGLATMSAQFILGSLAQSFGVEMTNATFAGGGSLELLVSGFLYWQETSLD